jgi:hypothetical protein
MSLKKHTLSFKIPFLYPFQETLKRLKSLTKKSKYTNAWTIILHLPLQIQLLIHTLVNQQENPSKVYSFDFNSYFFFVHHK